MSPKAFLFDPNRCTGCQACELACTIENELGDQSWRRVSTFNTDHRPGAPTVHLSLACNHCAEPPCADACPALAYTKDAVTGLVTLHAERCIGCNYCSWACPYDAPRFDDDAGVMTKCTFCSHRQAEGLEPACVTQCPTGALGFGALDALHGVAGHPGLPTLEPGPSIRFVPWRTAREPEPPPPAAETPPPEPVPRKITLRAEWPLAAFTLMAAALVGTWTASAYGTLRLPPFAFLAAVAFSLALSTLHLGRKWRAWRAILNFRRSWLSREVTLYGAFAGLAGLQATLIPESTALARITAWVGFLALFAMDRVYDCVRPPRGGRLHSSDVVPTGLYVTLILLGQAGSAVLIGGLKLAFYLGRPHHRRPGWSALRLGAGFALPVLLSLADPERWIFWTLLGTAVGEAVDRGELYTELVVPTPRGEMARRLGPTLPF